MREKQVKVPLWPCQVWGICKMASVEPSRHMDIGGGHGHNGLNVKAETGQEK